MNLGNPVNSTTKRLNNGWHKGCLEFEEQGKAFLSVVFSWDLPAALQRRDELIGQGRQVEVGGSAARYAGILSDLHPDAMSRHNPDAVQTSTGCPNRCSFCIVPKVEGELREKETWEPKSIVCDNNFTACSRRHFDRVIDSLKPIRDVDFNQGVSCLALTDYQASRFAELDLKYVRLAWDTIGYESAFMKGYETLRRAGIPKGKIGVYVLIGFNDTPEDALYRLESVKKLGILPFPMRYQPLDTPKRNSFVGEHWTHNELVRYCRYWTNLSRVRGIPFADFRYPSPPKRSDPDYAVEKAAK